MMIMIINLLGIGMKIIVDTNIWSIALRGKHNSANNTDAIISKLSELINESRVIMLNVIRQELLSGISDKKTFIKLREKLRAFPDLTLTTSIYELAAELFNTCRTKGIQGSHIDFLICAASVSHHYPIWSLDRDFQNYSKCIPLKRYDL